MAESLAQLRARYVYDPQALRYRSPRGRFVSQRAVKQALNLYVRRSQREIQRLGAQVASGGLDVAEWQRLTANLVKSTHLASAALARGGWESLDARAYGRIGAELKRQYVHLRKFAGEVEAGRLTPGQIRARAGMYSASARSVFEDTRRDLAADAFTLERNILGRGEHCKQCQEQSDRGWVPVGQLVPIGERTCLSHCLCRYGFK